MIYEDICTLKTYEKDGVEKKVWLKCGTMRTMDSGKRFIEMFHCPETTFFVFTQKSKDENEGNGL